MLIVEEFDNWHPGISVIDIVTEAGGVDDSQSNYFDGS